MVIISLLLVLILLLLLRCTVIKFGKKSTSSQRHRRHGAYSNRENLSNSSRVVHTELDLEAPYAPTVTIAPPTYAETLLADQIVQSVLNEEVADCSDEEVAGCSDDASERSERSSSAQPMFGLERNQREHDSLCFNREASYLSLFEENENVGSSEQLVQHSTQL